MLYFKFFKTNLNYKMQVFVKNTTKSIKMTCINSMVDLKPQNHMKDKCQNNSIVEIVLFTFSRMSSVEKKDFLS